MSNNPDTLPIARSRPPTVAIIGAGAAGLAAAKHLLAEGCDVLLFEHKVGPGGVWNIDPANRLDSPVYADLETNVPRALMTFSDHPWPPNTSLFPKSPRVQEYLQSYLTTLESSERARTHLHVMFNAEVIDIRKVTHQKTPQWKVVVRQRHFNQPPNDVPYMVKTVVVAMGNYHHKFIPEAMGDQLAQWDATYPGSLIHSIQYRRAEDFTGQTVLVVGNSASGWDISANLAPTARMVIVSSQRYNPLNPALSAPTLIGVPAIAYLDVPSRAVAFTDGRKAYNIDRIIYCTGYAYDFSFIKKGTAKGDERVFASGVKVSNVYEHMFYTEDPTLAFVGLPTMSAAFNVAEAQSAVVARVFSGRLPLPSRSRLRSAEQSALEVWEQQMQAGEAGAGDYHSFRLTTDKDYINRLLMWAMSTRNRTVLGDHGQSPPFWCRCLDHARDQSRAVRVVFKGKGAERHRFTSFRSLGFELVTACEKGGNVVSMYQGRCRSCFMEPAK